MKKEDAAAAKIKMKKEAKAELTKKEESPKTTKTPTEGATNTVATANSDKSYCQEVYDRIAGKLANAGFNCTK
jgi:hypothetical protein